MTESRAYIFNLETTKIELHFEKAEYDALSAEQKSELKSAFLWSNRGKCWVSRAKEPNLWRAKAVAKKLGFTEEEREGERLSFGEQLDRQAERAEARADRLEGYAANASGRAEQLQSDMNAMHGDVAFFTQPNINSAGGRAFTRRREKIFARYEKGIDEYRKSEYFLSKAETARNTAAQAQYNDPAFLSRRIKECKKEIEKRNKNALSYEETMAAIERGEIRHKFYNDDPLTVDEVQEWYDNELELIEVAIDKLSYLENRLEELGGIKFSRDNIKAGYIVKLKGYGAVEVVRTGPQNITYIAPASGFELKAAYAEIIEVVKAAERKKEGQPFKVGEKYKGRIYDKNYRRVEAVYEIVKATASTIWLKREGSDEAPFSKKPKIVQTSTGKMWRFSIDGYAGNCFYKEVAGDEKV